MENQHPSAAYEAFNAVTMANDGMGLAKTGAQMAGKVSDTVHSGIQMTGAGMDYAGGIMGGIGAVENTVRGHRANQASIHLLEGKGAPGQHRHSSSLQEERYLEQASITQHQEAKRRAARTVFSVLGTAAGVTAAVMAGTTVGSMAAGAAIPFAAVKAGDSIHHKYKQHKSAATRRRMAAKIIHSTTLAMHQHGPAHPRVQMLTKMGIEVPKLGTNVPGEIPLIPIRSPVYIKAVSELAKNMTTDTSSSWVHKTRARELR